MTRVPAAGIICVCMLLVLSGCQGFLAQVPPRGTPTAATTPVVLTAAQPSAEIAQPVAADASIIYLNVSAVQNPTNQGLDIALAVADAATPSLRFEVGRVSVFPANHPGAFLVALPANALELVRHKPTIVVVTIMPTATGTVLQSDVSLRLTAQLSHP